MRQIDGAEAEAVRFPSGDSHLCDQSIPRTVDRCLDRDRAQVGKIGDAGDQPLRRLIRVKRGFDRLRSDTYR